MFNLVGIGYLRLCMIKQGYNVRNIECLWIEYGSEWLARKKYMERMNKECKTNIYGRMDREIGREIKRKSRLYRVDKCSKTEANSLRAKGKHTKQYTVWNGFARIYR